MQSSFLANTTAIIWVQLTCRIPHLMHGPYSTRSSDWCWRTYNQYSSMFLPFQVVINGLYSSENNVQASFDSPVKVRHMRSPVRGAIRVLCLNFNNEKYVVALVGFFAGGLFLQYFCYWNFTGVCFTTVISLRLLCCSFKVASQSPMILCHVVQLWNKLNSVFKQDLRAHHPPCEEMNTKTIMTISAMFKWDVHTYFCEFSCWCRRWPWTQTFPRREPRCMLQEDKR